VRLESHPTARNRAIAAICLHPGAVIATVPSLATSLLPSQKGFRCDFCHRRASEEVNLNRCSGCASYWYCGKECQSRQWRAHHKRICKRYNRFVASPAYQSLSQDERVDAILLSHLIAENIPNDAQAVPVSSDGSFSTFLELMKTDHAWSKMPPICGDEMMARPELRGIAEDLFCRFGKNNFIVHSHLNSYAHGIFPLASRLFNHACIPNAAAKYIISMTEPVRMEVVALDHIAVGEEVLINYLDPALPCDTRDAALQSNYGFTCTCAWCIFGRAVRPPPPPGRRDELKALETKLRVLVYGKTGRMPKLPQQKNLFMVFPDSLRPLLHESYLPVLSEQFSRSSHDLAGHEDEALESGLTLLALYALIYPINYPQLGMHALELAKTAWNASITMDGDSTRRNFVVCEMEVTARACAHIASQILRTFGREGDEDDNPLDEVDQLQSLMS